MIFNSYLYNILSEIAKDKNLKITSMSNNYILEIKKQKDKIYVIGNSLPLNNVVSQKIVNDKSALSSVLKLNNIPCVEHKIYKYNCYNEVWNLQDIEKDLENFKKIVIKDNSGSCGKNVFKVCDKKELKKVIKILLNNHLDIAVSLYVENANEYRAIILDNKCLALYFKEKPYVIGDGKSKVKALIKEKFGEFDFELSKEALNKKPNLNEIVSVGWKNNLKFNASPINVTDITLKNKFEAFAKKVVKNINIRFCSVDIFEKAGELSILEVNYIVSMEKYSKSSIENYNKTKNIFELALEKSFESLSNK